MNPTEHMSFIPRWLKITIAVLLAVFLLTLSINNIRKHRYIGRAPSAPHTIMISGSGKITATPTIAVTQVGLVTEKSDVAAAQMENSKKMNGLIAALQSLGIAKDDIRTAQYQIYPKYTYDQKSGSQINGYSVTQSVEVKIRNLEKISAVLAKAGEAGANQINGVQFTIDEPKNLRAQAREEAVKDAKEKAKKLAEQLGVRLGKIVGFSESGDAAPPVPMYYAKDMAVGAPERVAPDIQAGSLEVTSQVDITFELK